ncbi:hypothetical protein EIN_411120 [Entamoeba invadens IP1]|uniref:AB hydrolase-1 domain-containing protein n=1 Tax=Entamoeba invadens IP1 TaxID=370355 RepID=A0A0A1U710_ENTIV|nr:hypothetical protein EIN_411120 [Entamoeba invadens IP1]ELP87759.1 hypothetical protein EIN_411120 [Entamoeba invadens IP1]|eukprot:XP_004254530.1 hypothetical protein EIN_411120 [Entamoeba invadens IP1]
MCRINNRHVPYYTIQATTPTRAWVIFSHGNAEDISISYHHLKIFSNIISANIIGYDYRGYGTNAGEPTEADCKQDLLAIFTMVINEMQIPIQNIILMGHSIGCGPTLWLAREIQNGKMAKKGLPGVVGAVVSVSGFTSCCAVVDRRLSYIPFTDMFDNENSVAPLRMPLFIAHGNNDEIINVSHAIRLWDDVKYKENGSLFIVDGCDHNSILGNVEFQTALVSFLEEYFVKRIV